MQKILSNAYKKIAEAIYTILWEIEYVAFEAFSGITIMALGISFLCTDFSSAKIIRRAIDGGNEALTVTIISVFMVIFGIFKLIALTQCRFTPQKWLVWRRNLAGICVFLWGFIFTVFAHSPTKAGSLVFIISIIGFSMWAFIRLVLERRAQRLLDPDDSYKNE